MKAFIDRAREHARLLVETKEPNLPGIKALVTVAFVVRDKGWTFEEYLDTFVRAWTYGRVKELKRAGLSTADGKAQLDREVKVLMTYLSKVLDEKPWRAR